MALLDGWTFCPRCAGGLRRGAGVVRCPACGFEAWAHSVPATQAVVERDGRVLLGRRAFEPSAGLWDLPGGFLDEGEPPLDGLRRELREETGLEIEPTQFLGVWLDEYDGRTVLALTWLARPVSGEPAAADDVAELRWFGADELPAPQELAFPSFVEILSLWRRRHEHA